jgi:FkbM family methyltransferase
LALDLATGARVRNPIRSLTTAWQLIAEGNLRAARRAAAGRVRQLAHASRKWWLRDHAWMGRWVAMRGNYVTIDGCRFDVSHPAISDAMRSRLWRGRYERSERAVLAAILDPERPVIELGGGIGVVAAIVNRRLRDPHEHVVIEPNPSLIRVLERQRMLNGAAFAIEHGALDYSGLPFALLPVDTAFIEARVGTSGRTRHVPSLTFLDVVERYPWRDVTLICDIEGMEVDLVWREGDLVARHCRTIVMEIHPEFRSETECRSVFAGLHSRGFETVASLRKVHAFRRR